MRILFAALSGVCLVLACYLFSFSNDTPPRVVLNDIRLRWRTLAAIRPDLDELIDSLVLHLGLFLLVVAGPVLGMCTLQIILAEGALYRAGDLPFYLLGAGTLCLALAFLVSVMLVQACEAATFLDLVVWCGGDLLFASLAAWCVSAMENTPRPTGIQFEPFYLYLGVWAGLLASVSAIPWSRAVSMASERLRRPRQPPPST